MTDDAERAELAGPIVLFDGVCNLCNGTVNWLIDADPDHALRFASLQGSAGQTLLRRYGLPTDELESLVLVDRRGVFVRSDAVLGIVRHLRWRYRWMVVATVVPRFIRDAVYRCVAANRYRWFGRSESCRLPGPETAGRFVDEH